MAYAEGTKVPIEQTKTEIERMVTKFGATSFMIASQSGHATIMFEATERRIRFDVAVLPEKQDQNTATRNTAARENRRRWRALLLCIKAKIESVDSKIETFEEAFLSHVVMPDGSTVYSAAQEAIALAYKDNTMVPLLPPLSKGRKS
jgi:hypothetical protein